jgi:hypothetical protein
VITFSKLGTYGDSRLGNQMFQYAAAKSAALNANCLFAIPIENQTLSNCFDLECSYYSLENKTHDIVVLSKYIEETFHFEERFNSLTTNHDLEGYFQSEKYFSKCQNDIRKDFTFKKEVHDRAKYFIESSRSIAPTLVSIHVRRGDYLWFQNFHPVCTLDYYKRAIDMFDDCTFIIFSDDMEWSKRNLTGTSMVYSTLQNDAQDLCAMSLCDHHIIANSSFSWWGAWLNKNTAKQIVAPRNWFGIAYQDKDTCDLYCKDWKVI